MSRFDRNKCIEATGGQFDLIMVAAKRARDIQKGATPYISNASNNAITTALQEIEQGYITKEYLYTPDFDPDNVF